MVANINFTPKLRDYLIPKNINLNDNLPLGIILSFTKTITISPELFDSSDDYEINKIQKFSVLIFYSFLTGRVERYLMNYSHFLKEDSNFRSKNTNFTDESKFIYKNKEVWIDHTIEHTNYYDDKLIQTLKDFNIFDNGIITSHFYGIFILELIREWIWSIFQNGWLLSYKDPNLDNIRRLTKPLLIKDEDSLKIIPLSSGNISLEETLIINEDTKYKLKNIYPTKTVVDILDKYYELNKPKSQYFIYIPKTFEKNFASQILSKKLGVKTLSKKDYPQGLLDFKKSLSFSTIENINDFPLRIRKYNYHMNKILIKHQPYKNHNPNL